MFTFLQPCTDEHLPPGGSSVPLPGFCSLSRFSSGSLGALSAAPSREHHRQTGPATAAPAGGPAELEWPGFTRSLLQCSDTEGRGSENLFEWIHMKQNKSDSFFRPLSAVLRFLFWGSDFGPEGWPEVYKLRRGEGRDAGEGETVARCGNFLQAAGARHRPPPSAGLGLGDGTPGTVKITLTLGSKGSCKVKEITLRYKQATQDRELREFTVRKKLVLQLILPIFDYADVVTSGCSQHQPPSSQYSSQSCRCVLFIIRQHMKL